MAKVLSDQPTGEESDRFQQLHRSESEKVLALHPDEIFTVEEAIGAAPQRARINATVTRARCGEATMETRISGTIARPRGR